MPLDDSFYPATYPHYEGFDWPVRLSNVVEPTLNDPMQPLNQYMLIESAEYDGVIAWDYQNPYVFASRGILTGADLVPAVAIAGDTMADVQSNIYRTNGIILP